jgi:hypothetical protein
MKFFQLGIPHRRTFTLDEEGLAESRKIIKDLNGLTPIFRTINDFQGLPNHKTAIVSKLFFDFDVDKKNPDDEEYLIQARKLHEYLKERNIKHFVYFSGRGFHIFVLVKPKLARMMNNADEAVRIARLRIINKLNLMSDPSTKDLMRFARMPNTINIKTNKFCIPLKPEELYLSREEIEKLAETQRFGIDPSCGEELIDITKYDTEKVAYEPKEVSKSLHPVDEKFLQKKLPKCILASLSEGSCGYYERYAIITALRDACCYSRSDTKKVLKKYLTEEKYYHCVRDEGQVDYLYDRQKLLFPNCTTLKEQGICVKGCSGQDVYEE